MASFLERSVTDTNSLRTDLAPHLPHLRRYARALTGSQRSGDVYVRMALETLLNNPETAAYDPALPPRLALFRLFNAVAQGADVVGPDHLPAGSLQALLLTGIEGFDVSETARILDMAPADIIAGVAAAKAAIFETMRSRVLIIEDEPMIALHLEQIVEDMGHDVVAMAMTHKDALARANEERPELVLADIQLADGSSGLEAVQEILQRFDVPVVFITAFPERLLTGERPEPTYLVTKPFNTEAVVATIGQALLSRSLKTAAP